MFHHHRPRCGVARLTALAAILVTLVACTRPPGAGPNPAGPGAALPSPQQTDLILATTTSTQDSGLLDVLIPRFEQQTHYRVKTIAVGTGQALALGERGEADVLLVHDPASEKKTVAKGAAVNRRLVMYNDFVLVGPPADPAHVKGAPTTAQALGKVAAARSPFISRGDDSGTHKKELSLWQAAGQKPEGNWYQQTGSGMGQTLNVAAEKAGYTLTDRATYLANREHLQLEIVLEGDAPLLNIYHIMQVNPEKFSKVNAAGAQAMVEFMTSAATQSTIGQFGVDKYKEPLFFPAAEKTEAQLLQQK